MVVIIVGKFDDVVVICSSMSDVKCIYCCFGVRGNELNLF